MIRAIIVDDERPSVDKMGKLLGDSGVVDIKGKFLNPLDALEFVKKVKIDTAFIDIEMPEMDGFQLANRVFALQEWTAVVFVTAYNEYAVEAFRINALDYLLKPVDKKRLNETLERIRQEKNININQSRMQVRCFGKFKVIAGSGEVKFRTSKAEELLAYLIDGRGAEISRDEIIDRLWPDYEGDRAVAHFNTTLYNVRKALQQNGIQASIKHSRGCYCLEAASIDCDYHRFLSLTAAPTAINVLTISDYEALAALYTGDYLESNQFQWSQRSRMQLKEKYVQLVLDMAEYYKAVGEQDRAAELLKTGLKHEPLHTDLNYRLVETLMVAKKRIAAVKYYNAYRRELKNELGLEPDVKLRKLMA
ncbi:MAG: hypothetical protein VR67_01995 [Peptococcaceae bacterium BRH_c8a]|nr:MAG: hypothetical protein VR67_01995 [Peptococcaceae bacterium BRH_c8a]